MIFLSLQGCIFNFLNTHTKERITFIVKKHYFQLPNNFRTFEGEMCIRLISLNENPNPKTWQD